MKTNNLLLIISLLINTILFSQQATGKIVDTEKQPIAYATIQINDFGTLSNEEGEFTIDTTKFNKKDQVIISFLGYKTLEFNITDLKLDALFTLEEDINEIDEVEVSAKKYSLEEILEKVKENIDSNYVKTPTKQQLFIRNTNYNKYRKFEFEFKKSTLLKKKELKIINKSLKELIQQNINESSTEYSENLTELLVANGKKKITVIKATRLLNKENDKSTDKFQNLLINTIAKHLEKGSTYKVNSGILPIKDSLKIDDDLTKSMYKDSLKVENKRHQISRNLKAADLSSKRTFDFIHKNNKYLYKLKGTATFNDEKIYVINFSPKKSSALYKGTLYVNAFDFAVVKIKYGYAEGKSFSKNLKLLLGVKFKQSLRKVEIYYQKNNDDKYFLKFIKQETKAYSYINRSIRFKKNRANKSEDKKILKMEFLLEMDNANKSELFVLDHTDITKANFDKFKEQKKYKINYIPKYDSNIWKDYNVISPVNEIKNYNTGAKTND